MSTAKTATSKPPFSYHGGKQMLVPKLKEAEPKGYRIYCEPFFGGGAFFFAKEPSKINFINDINEQVTNFYVTVKKQFNSLKVEIDCTLHSEEQFLEARRIYQNCKGKDEQEKVMRAWALFVLANQSFLHSLDNTFAGTTQHYHQLALSPGTGKHTITVTDEEGNSVMRRFEIIDENK